MSPNNTYIQILQETSQQLKQLDLIEELVHLQKKLQEEEMYVVITGIFKRGKSTLINALIGDNIMPTGVVPVTAIITILKYATSPFIEIVYMDKKSEQKAVTDLPLFVSEEENPENNKKVSHVIVYHSAPILQQITIIDTPGVGSSLQHNTDTTLQFLTKIDLAIFVLSADMPISKSDIEFLTQLYSQVDNIIFVENKMDIQSKIDLERLITHNKKMIAQQCNMPIDSISIIPISAALHLQGNKNESGLDNLLKVLNQNITQNKRKILQQSTDRQLSLIKQSLLSLIQLRIENLQMPLQKLEERMHQFQATKNLILNEIEGFQAILEHHIQKLNEMVHNHCNNNAKMIETNVVTIIESYLHPSYQLFNKTEQKQLITTLNKTIRNNFEQLKNQLEAESKSQFKEILTHYLFNSKNILHNIAIHFQGYLNTGIESIVEKFDWKAYTAFYITLNGLDKETQFTINKANFFFSKKTKEQYITKAILKQYHEIIIHNTASIIYEVQYKIQESFRKFNADFKIKVQLLLQTLETVMKDTMEKSKELNFNTQSSILELEDLQLKLNNISKQN
ncbi:MAG: dynamin family protein [Bacteroidota bacterium]|nr:dynamin family protein [Bacteroidota bacterium]